MLLIVLTSVTSPAGQSPQSIQGVWRNVERVIPASTNPGDRVDPFGHVPVGTQADVQPGLLIITKRDDSRTTDTAITQRPKNGYAMPGQPTVEELQARWVRSPRTPEPTTCLATS